MEKEQIYLDDIKRILFGEAPPVFLLEVFLRTLFIYLVLLLIVKWLGKRMAAQLTINEKAVIVTLGAIVAGPMQMPDRGILLGATILVYALIFQRGLGWLSFKYDNIERLTQGDISLLVKDGRLQLDEMRKTRITKQQLFAGIRNKNIYNLGRVERLYMESCGVFSIFTIEDKNKPGLPVLPPTDEELYKEQKHAENNIRACSNCGTVEEQTEIQSCRNCKHEEWVEAIIG